MKRIRADLDKMYNSDNLTLEHSTLLIIIIHSGTCGQGVLCTYIIGFPLIHSDQTIFHLHLRVTQNSHDVIGLPTYIKFSGSWSALENLLKSTFPLTTVGKVQR